MITCSLPFPLRRVAVIALAAFGFFVEARAQAPAITEQPKPLVVGPGDRAGFAVTATGAAPLGFQWYHDGIQVPDATGDLLLLPNAQTAQSGDYTVKVSNPEGSTLSPPVKLVVAPYTTQWVDEIIEPPELRYGALLLELPDGRLMTYAPPSESAGPMIRWNVLNVALQDDGDVLVVGSISNVTHGGTFTSSLLMRLNEDGSRDNTFAPAVASSAQIAPASCFRSATR